MFIDELYNDDGFNNFLVYTANKNMFGFDDYKQDVFLEIMESNAKSNKEYKKAAWRVRDRNKKREIDNKTISLDAFGDIFSNEERSSVLWEDTHILA